MSLRFDRDALIERLEPLKYDEQGHEEQARLEQMSLPGVLLTLAEINHEREYEYCRRAAEHLLGKLPEPEDIELD